MSVIRDPSSDLIRLQERMNQLFRQTFTHEGGVQEGPAGLGWVPPVDIQELDDRLILRADLPGVPPEQIELRIEDDRLTLRGERRSDSMAGNGESHRRERPHGRFHRTFELPRNVDQAGVRAELKHGALEVVLPKKAGTRIKPIKVEAR